MALNVDDLRTLTSREDLAAVLEGRSRSDIRDAVRHLGPERVVTQVVDVLNRHAAPRGELPRTATVQWAVTSERTDPMPFFFRIDEFRFAALPGTVEGPRATITLDATDFLLLMAGRLDVVRAFLSRRLRVTGDIMFARTIEGWFGR